MRGRRPAVGIRAGSGDPCTTGDIWIGSSFMVHGPKQNAPRGTRPTNGKAATSRRSPLRPRSGQARDGGCAKTRFLPNEPNFSAWLLRCDVVPQQMVVKKNRVNNRLGSFCRDGFVLGLYLAGESSVEALWSAISHAPRRGRSCTIRRGGTHSTGSGQAPVPLYFTCSQA